MKTVATALLFACLPMVCLADEAANQTVEEEYSYGMNLDVSRVISIQTDSSAALSCGLADETMVYEDSHGKQHELTYQVVATGCSNG